MSNAYEEILEMDLEIELKLADDIIMRGEGLYAIIEAQRKGEEITRVHRDQALAGVLKIMSLNSPELPPIKPEEIKKYRGYMEDMRRYMEGTLDKNREYLPYVQQAYEMIEYSQEIIDYYDAEQLLCKIFEVNTDQPNDTELGPALRIIHHDTVDILDLSESDIVAKIGKWITILQRIKHEDAVNVCNLLKRTEKVLIAGIKESLAVELAIKKKDGKKRKRKE